MAEHWRTAFTKLNGENYFTWKFKMEMYLRKEKLWTAITSPIPAVPAADDEGVTPQMIADAERKEAEFYEKDEAALALIALCVEDTQLVHFRNQTTAKAAWAALKTYYERNTLGNKIRIMRQITDLKLAENGNMEQHLAKLTDLFQKLTDLGETQFNDSWQVAITLSSLPPSYDTLVQAFEVREDGDLTLSLIHSKLTQEYLKRTGKMGESSSGNQATVLKTTNTKLKCFFCKKESHIKKDCKKYKEWLKKKGNNKANEKVNTVAHNEEFLFQIANTAKSNEWLIDSGATSHVSNNKQLFETFDSTQSSSVTVANDDTECVSGKGTCVIQMKNEHGDVSTALLQDVLYAPNIRGNMISVQKLMEKDYKIVFDKNKCEIMKSGKQIAVADKVNGLFSLRQPNAVNLCVTNKHKEGCLHYWHRIYGHRDPNAIKLMHKEGMIHGMKLVDCGLKTQCEVCLEAKSTRVPFPKKSETKSKEILDLVHTDVCGPMQTESMGHKKYFLTIIDDFSKYTVVYFLRHKSEASEKIKHYIAMVQNKFNKKPKVIRSDRGGEYVDNTLKQYLHAEGILIQYTAPYSPQQNGVAERKNRTLVEMARCMLTDADLPKFLWAEAINTANYLQNRSLTKDAIPIKLWSNEKPSALGLEVFGTKCYVHSPLRKKLDNTSKEMFFIGYDDNSKAYRCYDASNRKLVISRDVRFVENRSHSNEVSVDMQRKKKSMDSIENEIVIESDIDDSFESANSEESAKETDFESCDQPSDVTLTPGDFHQYRDTLRESSDETATNSSEESNSEETTFVDANLDQEYGELSTSFGEITIDSGSEYFPSEIETDVSVHSPRTSQRQTKGVPPERYQANLIIEPKSLNEALAAENKSQWLKAMEEEIASMKKNGTWDLVSLPKDRKAIGSKWVYKTKTDATGKIVKYKARLVAQGFSQKFGTDYDQVFAPVARQTTFRIMLAIASKQKWIVHHLDVETAFLNGSLSETIYMKQPPGFECDNKELVCRLNKSIYGLKQAAKVWNDKVHRILIGMGFEQSKNDPCLYSKNTNGEWIFVLIYVDDIMVMAKTMSSLRKIKSALSEKFDIKDLGEIKQYLGIEITRNKDGIFQLNQSKYIKKIASDFGLAMAKASNIPMQANYGKTPVNPNEGLLLSNEKYRKLLGSLLFVSVNTRPDVSAAISILAQKVSKPRQQDWEELKRVLKYLNGTANLKLTLGKIDHKGKLLFGYSDANWAEDKSDRKSNSGHVFLVNGGTVCWSTRKQSLVTLSTCEAEFVALSEACRAASWIRRILADLKQDQNQPTIVYEDNQSCLELIEKEQRLSERSKHIDTRFYFVKDYIDKGLVDCIYCPTNEMLADALTKALNATKFISFRNSFGLHD